MTALRETGLPKGKLSVNAKLLRDLIRSRVKLDQIQLRVFRRDVLPLLRDMEADVIDVLASGKGGTIRQDQLRALLSDVRGVIENTTEKIPPALEQAVTDAASREVRMVRGSMLDAVPEFRVVLGKGLPAESFAQITQRTVEEVLQPKSVTWGTRALARVKDQLGASVLAGEDMREAALRVMSVAPATRSEALTVARTGILRASTLAHDEFREQPENRELLKGVQAVATLDTRTCAVCGGLDGKWWSFEKDEEADGMYSERPIYPLHNRCRCQLVDVLKSPEEIGLPGVKWSKSTRASMDGQVPEALTFPDWLESQPVNIQKSVLGASRWEMWKNGSADFEDFSFAGRMRTLDELGEVL